MTDSTVHNGISTVRNGISSANGGITDAEVDMPRIEAAVREILAAIGEDPERDGLQKTPSRVAQMYAEVFSGLREDPVHHLEVQFEADHDEMVMVRDIPFYSMCEHQCMSMRGVQKPGSLTITSAVRGLFLSEATRSEAMQLIGIGR